MNFKNLTAVSVAVVGLAGGTGYAVAAGGNGQELTPDPPQAPSAAISQTPTDLGDAFSLLTRTSGTARDDPTNAGIAVPPTIRADGLNFSLARRAALGADSPAEVWLAPGDGRLCLFMQTTAKLSGFACSTSAVAETHGISFTLQAPGGGPTVVMGAVPNGTDSVSVQDANGTKTSVKVTDNAYAYADTNAPKTLTFTGSYGSVSDQIG